MDYNKLYEQYQKLLEENQKLKAENEEYRKLLGLPTPVSCENCSGNISVEIDINTLAQPLISLLLISMMKAGKKIYQS